MTPSPNDYACKQIFAGTGYVLIHAIDVRNRSFAGGIGIEEEKRLKIGCIVCWVMVIRVILLGHRNKRRKGAG
jgi:hypothetical protein